MGKKKLEDHVSLEDLAKLKKKKRINSRTKGNAFERKIADILNEAYNETCFSRTPGSGAFGSTHKLPTHMQLRGDLITPLNFPYVIECKKGYNFKISELLDKSSLFWSIIRKIEIESKSVNKLPLLIFQQDRKVIYTLTYSDIFNNISVNSNPDFVFVDKFVIFPLDTFLKFPLPFHQTPLS